MKRILAFTLMLATAGIAKVVEHTEVVSMRTKYQNVYKNENGSFTAEIKNHPIHNKNLKG